jgi:hypothetical protein
MPGVTCVSACLLFALLVVLVCVQVAAVTRQASGEESSMVTMKDALCQLQDLIDPATPGKVRPSCLRVVSRGSVGVMSHDITRSPLTAHRSPCADNVHGHKGVQQRLDRV